MAIIHPRLSSPLAEKHGGYKLELELLELLRMGLPDDFDVFHGLTWHRAFVGSKVWRA